MAIFGVAFGYPEGEPDTAVEPAKEAGSSTGSHEHHCGGGKSPAPADGAASQSFLEPIVD